MLKYPDYLRLVDDCEPELSAGILQLPTGEIVACDPLTDDHGLAFSRKVAAGAYPVEIYLNDYDEHALAVLRFNNEEIASWEMATLPGQKLADLPAGSIFGYPVDAGLGCFMDKSTAALLSKHETETQQRLGGNYISYYDDVIDVKMSEAGDYNLLNFQPYADQPNNCIMFASGYGDGFYASYWGLNAAGLPVCLVTDFGTLSDEAE